MKMAQYDLGRICAILAQHCNEVAPINRGKAAQGRTQAMRVTDTMQKLIQRLRRRAPQQFATLRHLPATLRLVWQAAPGWMLAWFGVLIVQGLLPVLTVTLTRDAIDGLVSSIEADLSWPTLQPTLLALAALVVVRLVAEMMSSVSQWVQTAQSEIVRDAISDQINAKAAELDMRFYETSDYYDKLHRARQEAYSKPIQLVTNLGVLLQNTLTLLGMFAILLSYAVWLPFVLIIGSLPALWVVLRFTRRYNRWRLENTANMRLSLYYQMVLTEREAASEVRLFGLAEHYKRVFHQLRASLRHDRLKLQSQKLITDIFAALFSLVVVGGVMLWMGLRVLQGFASFGDLAAFYQIFNQGQSSSRLLLQRTGTIFESLVFIDNLFEFLNLQPTLKAQPEKPAANVSFPLQQGITFEDITFYYPGSQRPALHNFNLTLPAGKVIALVGENGIGKSTLVKLLCRFYDPDAGRVLWDGVDIRSLPLERVRQNVTVLFQQPYHYHESVFHNIAVGDLASRPTLQAVRQAAAAAKADGPIEKLPHDYDATLGKLFGGAELSGGEWQRIALARAFLRQAPIVVLDEPTSAMDSWAELDWLHRFRQMATGRTAIMITHRFTTAMQADYIFVMGVNRVIEQGTHDDLLAQNGRYAQSWHAQMQG